MEKELAMKYWQAADGIAAFACAHMVAFLLALLSKDARYAVEAAPWLTRGSVVLFWLIYCGGMYTCIKFGRRLLEDTSMPIVVAWDYALWGRLTAVSIFSLISLLALFGPSIDAVQLAVPK